VKIPGAIVGVEESLSRDNQGHLSCVEEVVG
jgi:hypothetical protein